MADRSAILIGGGITGVLTARELLRAGWQVTILEGLHVGAGSSSRTAAGIRQQFSTPATVLGMRHAVATYRELGEEFGSRCIEQVGYLFLHGQAGAWAAAKVRAALQHDLGLAELEVLEREALLARFPWVDPEVCVGGTWCPTDGFLHPAVVYQEGARRVRELGGTIVQKAQVTGGEHAGGRLVAVTSTAGRFAADVFVDCTNAWTGQLAARLGAGALPVSPIKRYIWFVRRGGDMSAQTLASMPMVIAPSGVYGRPENGDTLLLGWAHGKRVETEVTAEGQDTVETRYAHDGGVDAVPFEAWMHMAEAVPAVGDFDGLTATTSGYYAVSPDHNPFLGYDLQVPNLMRLVGFSGHGAMFGPFTAKVAAALAEAGGQVDHVVLPEGRVPLAEFALDRTFDAPEAMVI